MQEAPSQATSTLDQQQLRSYAYNALARVAKRLPHLFSGNITVVEMLLGIMSKEDNNSRIAIQVHSTITHST